MEHKLVRYKVKVEAVAEHRRLIEAVFEALQVTASEDLSYMVIELADGGFVHLKPDAVEDAFDLGELPAFRDFTRGIHQRCEEQPQVQEAKLVGSYRWASVSGAER